MSSWSVPKTPGVTPKLLMLAQELADLGIILTLISSDNYTSAAQSLIDFCHQQQISTVHCHHEYAIHEQLRDALIQTSELELKQYHSDSLFAYGSINTQSNTMFKVFTPFSRACCQYLSQSQVDCTPDIDPAINTNTPPVIKAASIVLQGDKICSKRYPVSTTAIDQQLNDFALSRILDYGRDRDYPSIDGTSGISPYLAIGAISPRQCIAMIKAELGHLPLHKAEPGFTWFNEILWREFYRHLMFAYPHLSQNKTFKSDTQHIAWSNDPALWDAWCAGTTGFPIVDAAMRCLQQTGWMHNRLRMICASFLCKDLHIDWRWGEAYFMQNLIDGDFASNNGGWQWSASTGADAAPYFRIFNPSSQSKKFDPQGIFIKQWLPELADVPPRDIHQPASYLQQHPEIDYPLAIVDHAQARLHSLALFKQ